MWTFRDAISDIFTGKFGTPRSLYVRSGVSSCQKTLLSKCESQLLSYYVRIWWSRFWVLIELPRGQNTGNDFTDHRRKKVLYLKYVHLYTMQNMDHVDKASSELDKSNPRIWRWEERFPDNYITPQRMANLWHKIVFLCAFSPFYGMTKRDRKVMVNVRVTPYKGAGRSTYFTVVCLTQRNLSSLN
jgi:hypothetical protein